LRLLPAFTCFYVSPKVFYGADDKSVILKDPEIDSVKSSFSSGTFIIKTTGTTKTNIRVHIRRRIVQIQCESPGIHRIIPIAAADSRETVDSSP